MFIKSSIFCLALILALVDFVDAVGACKGYLRKMESSVYPCINIPYCAGQPGQAQRGSCVKCYHCTSQGDPKCADSFKSSVQAVECKSDNSTTFIRTNLYATLPAEIFGSTADSIYSCHKIVLGTGTVIRTCLPGKKDVDTCKTLKDESKSEDKSKLVQTCTSCDKDGCNAAGSLSLSLPLAVVAFVVSYVMYKQ